MTEAIIDRVLNLDSNDLDPIVQAVLNDFSATVTGNLSCEPTGAPSVGDGTLAILMVEGQANTSSGRKKWSAVVKAMDASRTNNQRGNSRVEIAAYDSELLGVEGIGVRAARCYQIDRLPDEEVWLWLENLTGLVGPPWKPKDYVRAAADVGKFSSYWSQQEMPSDAFLSPNRTLARFTLQQLSNGLLQVDSDESPESVLKRLLPEETYSAAMNLAAATDAASPVLEKTPELLVHGDCHPRNLFLSLDGAPQETIAFDWASIGAGYIGTDIGSLVGSGTTWHIDESRSILGSESLYFQTFLNELIRGGWQRDPDEARLGYLFRVCRFGMMSAGVAVAIQNRLPVHDHVVARSGEATPEEAHRSYASRLPLFEPLAEELATLAGRLG